MISCEWEAWYDRMPGKDPGILHVAGRCTVESSSIELSLERTNEGVRDDPKVVALVLKAHPPSGGDDQMAEKEVGTTIAEAGVETVEIRGEGGGTVTVRDVD